MKNAKITRHKETVAPWECHHCGAIWYGMAGDWTILPPERVLCVQCWSALDRHLSQHHRALYQHMEEQPSALHELVREWIADKRHPSHPRPAARNSSRWVPQWMRSAIDAGMVKTNSKETYVIYSQGQVAIQVEVVD